MNIVAINGSHRAGKGTAALLQAVLDATGRQGARGELVELSELDIRFCVGCNACMGKNRCGLHDDMDALYEKLLRADGIVLGSPVYFGTVSARMKNFMDRTRRCTWWTTRWRGRWAACSPAQGCPIAAPRRRWR